MLREKNTRRFILCLALVPSAAHGVRRTEAYSGMHSNTDELLNGGEWM